MPKIRFPNNARAAHEAMHAIEKEEQIQMWHDHPEADYFEEVDGMIMPSLQDKWTFIISGKPEFFAQKIRERIPKQKIQVLGLLGWYNI